MKLVDRFHDLCRTPSDINDHLPTLARLVGEHQAQHVIELGARSGVSTVAWLHGLDFTGGRLTSVDISPPPDLGFYAGNWTFIQGDDTDPAVFRQLAPAEIVFIDTSHRFDHTFSELNLYRWLCTGVIVCHDTELAQPPDAPPRPEYPVKRAVEQFCDENGFEWSNDTRWPGLGVIEVR